MKKRKIKNRYKISDELWEKIEPLIPKHPNTHRFGGGRRLYASDDIFIHYLSKK